MFSEKQIALLSEKLSEKHVKTRQQAGRSLSYVEGWFAIQEANRIFGFDGWTRTTLRLEETNRDLVELKGYHQWRVGYLAIVQVAVGEIVRQGTGFGTGMAKPEALGEAIESAIKEAETDAMKRALMTFGNPFGLALYDKEQANVEREPETAERSPADDFFERAKLEISNATTLSALEKWKDANLSHLNALPDTQSGHLRDQYKKRMGALSQARAA